MHVLKRTGLVVLAGVITSLPANIIASQKIEAPFWYVILFHISGALGAGMFAIFFGVIALLAGRNRSDGGLKPALITVAIVSIVMSYVIISSYLRR